MTRAALLLLAATAWSAEPLTNGEMNLLGWSDARPTPEKAAHLRQLIKEVRALEKEAPPLIARLGALAPRYGAGTAAAAAERSETRGAVLGLCGRVLLVHEEYSIIRRGYEFDRSLAFLSGVLKTKKPVPRKDLADVAALDRFQSGLDRLLRQLAAAAARDEAAYLEALGRERRERRRRSVALAAGGALFAALLLAALTGARLKQA